MENFTINEHIIFTKKAMIFRLETRFMQKKLYVNLHILTKVIVNLFDITHQRVTTAYRRFYSCAGAVFVRQCALN